MPRNRPMPLLRRLPALLGAAMLLLPWAYLMWNATLGEISPALRLRNKSTLTRLFAQTVRRATWRDILTARTQRAISTQVGEIEPLYGTATRANGQFYYSVFSKSPYKLFGSEGLSLIAVLPGDDLYQWPYITEYCTRDLAALRPEIAAGAADLRRIQDIVEAQGKEFLYVVTPSKAAVLHDHIPASLRCPAPVADRLGKLQAWREALRRDGVRFVDGAGLAARAQGKVGIDLFARGSAHWNELAAAMTAREVTSELDGGSGGRVMLTPFSFTWRASHRPQGTDRELTDALRLIWPDDHFAVPVLTYAANPPGRCRAVRIAEVGGSFLFRLNAVLTRQPCPPEIDQWFYWDQGQVRFPGETWTRVDPERRRQSLRDADLVIVEENEAVLPRAGHVAALLAALPHARAPAPQGAAAAAP